MIALVIRFVRAIDRLNEAVGRSAAWLVLGMVLMVALNVAMRYLLGHSSMALQELSWHLFGMVFLLASGWALKHDRHVRVDLWYASAAPRTRHAVNLIGHLLLTLPLCLVAIWVALPFVVAAWAIGERSPDAGGLGARWAIKAVIPLGLGLLLLQALAEALRAALHLTGHGALLQVTETSDTPGAQAPEGL